MSFEIPAVANRRELIGEHGKIKNCQVGLSVGSYEVRDQKFIVALIYMVI